ncbi:MAG: hypothetical protein U0Y82_16320 [Thermoleophilia bacterium]
MPDAPETPPTDVAMASGWLRAAAGETDRFLRLLAEWLPDTLPGMVRVERRGLPVLSARPVRAVTVTLPGDAFSMRNVNGRLQAEHATLVKGIVLSRDTPPVREWIDRLLTALAVQDAHARDAINSLTRLLEQ